MAPSFDAVPYTSTQLSPKQETKDEFGTCLFPLLTDGIIEPYSPRQRSVQQLTSLDLGSFRSARVLNYICAQHDVSIPTLFSTAWALVLARYLGTDKVGFLVITSDASTQREGVCRVELESIRELESVLKDVERETKLSFENHANMRSSVIGHYQHDFNTAVVFQGVNGMPVAPLLKLIRDQDKFISIRIREVGKDIEAALSYKPSFLPTKQALNLATSFEQVLSEIVQNSSMLLGGTNFMSPSHVEQIWAWNQEYPETVSLCVHDLFERQAKARPEAEAISSWDGSLSYAALSEISTRLAYHLIGLGIGPDTIVPLCFEKSLWAIVAIMAVIKAGGAIVNVDPKQPKARMAEIVTRVRAKLILTSRRHCALWQGTAGVFAIDAESVAGLPSNNKAPITPVTGVRPDNILYLIFTSGSTGIPKGCVVEHASFLTGAAKQVIAANMTPSTRVLQMTPYTFDVSMLEIFTSLTAGACICVPGEADLLEGIASVINKYEITFTFMTPSVVRHLNPDSVLGLKTLALGGESLSSKDVVTWADRLQLINGYGPTECSVASTINEKLSCNSDPANIGRGKGAICWVVDAKDHNKLVPIGAIGELLIQGPIVARGYFGDPEKTSEVFINAPAFLRTHKALRVKSLYKTGDLVRYNSDGTINYIGRKDTQVKLRGQRLELGEIEHHLSADHHVQQVAVLLAKSGRCKQQLTGVLSLRDFEMAPNEAEVALLPPQHRREARVLVAEVRDRLSQLVPTYMVPEFWAVLEAVPRTTSGKIDRVLLRKWVENISEEEFAIVTGSEAHLQSEIPATKIEEELQQIWSTVLNIPVTEVGFNCAFISLGGDSITSMQVITQCRSKNILLAVQDVLQSQSLSEAASRASYFEPALNEQSLTLSKSLPLSERISTLASYDFSKLGVSSIDHIEDVFMCSSMQEGILLGQAKNPGSYEIRQIFCGQSNNSESLDDDCLYKSWQKLINRNTSLRTIFADDISDDSSYHQVVLREAKANIKYVEYIGSGCESDVVSFLKALPIRTDNGGLPYELVQCRLLNGKVYFMLSINHALIDGGSTEILLRDFSLAYDDKLSIQPAPSYGEFISYLQDQPHDEAMKYWKTYLGGAQPCIAPTYGGSSTSPIESMVTTVEFSKIAELFSFCKENMITVANVLKTAWGIVLRTLTGSDDVCFGYVASGRDIPVPGIENMVGICINMLVCRQIVAPKDTVAELGQKMQSDYFSGLPHQHCSLAQIQHALNLSGMPLFNSILSLQRSVSVEACTTSSVSFELTGDVDPTDFDIAIGIEVGDTDLRISLGYWSSVMSPGEAANIASIFSGAISNIVMDGHARASQISLFNDRDAGLIASWNATAPVAIDACVHQSIDQQVNLCPDAPAICSWDGDFTYRQIDDLSTRLAHYLIRLGLKPESMIPFCFDKSAWATITVLAIMKAGGAFVGLSPAHPVTRLQTIMEECRTTVVLVQPQHAHLFVGLAEKVIAIDKLFMESLSSRPYHGALPSVKATSPAYVSFTSGSTGKPKGIVVEHGSLITSIRAHGAKFNFSPTMRALQFAAYAFDASISDTISVLVHGGCICVPSEQERVRDLAGAMNRMCVNWSFLTPKVASTLSPSDVPTLKSILLGGEAVSIEDVRPWIAASDVFVAYGPTETTICAMGTEPLTDLSDPLNLGRGVGTRLWITDPTHSDRLSPVGTIGELVIEGRLVARGYLHEPEKTKAVFIENPAWFEQFEVSKEPQAFYKTGDLVRYNLDGTMNFIGRKDNQVKIRGLRIELGEIEHAIAKSLTGLVQVIVDAVVLESGQALVAFLLLEDDLSEADTKNLIYPPDSARRAKLESLEKVLAHILPSYMIPSIFVPISRIPIGITGKVDRPGLRRPLQALTDDELAVYMLLDSQKRAPATPTESKLYAIWTEVLPSKVRSIGADDSFFRLGGDSVTVMKLATAARNAGIVISVADIFRSQTLSKMAAVIDASDGANSVDLTSKIEPLSLLPEGCYLDEFLTEIANHCCVTTELISDVYPCAPLQEGLATLSTRLQGASMLRSVHKMPKSIDINRFKNSWQKVVDAQSLLRTRIVQTDSSKLFQVVLRPAPIYWHSSPSLKEYLEHDDQIPVVLGNEFFRYAIVGKETDDDIHFVWTAHHACYDGWMIRLLFDEISRVYKEDVDATPEVPYTKFIKFLDSTDRKICEAYWEAQTAGETPASFPRMPSATYQPQTDSVLTHNVKMTRRSGTEITTSTLIRSSWAVVLARYLDNAEDVLFGQTLSGRNAPVPDIETMLGPTISVVPIRMHLDKSKTIADFLRDTQTQASEMIPFEHFGVQNIRSINAAARAVTDYKNVLITQTADNTTDRADFLGMEPVDPEKPSVETYALVVECTIGTNGLDLMVFYDSKVISSGKVERMMHHFEHTLQQMNTESTATLEQVDLFSERDRLQVQKWNNLLPAPENDLMHEVISRQAQKTPSAQAVDAWDGQLTYCELEYHSERLAHYFFATLGIHAEILVPMCFDKSVWTVVVMMAVLKAGGACVMLNPEHPANRLRSLLNDTKSPTVLVAPHYRHLFLGGNENVVSIDSHFIEKTIISTTASRCEAYIVPHNTAIVVFTSGSTGEPKGIVLEHGAMCSAAKHQGSHFGYNAGMRMLQFAHYTFDLSNAEIFYTLMHGGTVCIPSDHDRLNNLVRAINVMKVDTLILTPTVATLINPADVPTVGTLITAGEPANSALQQKWSGAVTYNNGYGPAETTSWSSRSISCSTLEPNNVGHAVGCRYWITEISDHNRLTPIGCVGELLLDGPILSRGYLNQPEKTATAFIVDPPWLQKDDPAPCRLYKSGDLARYAEDGAILIAGRKDAQVKLHGQRIELGEIEHHLRVHSEVEAAMVTLPISGPCHGRLVAALALKKFRPMMREGAQVTLLDMKQKLIAAELLTKIRQYLEELLPSYMVPTMWMVMDSVPLTPSRKINRNPISNYIVNMSDKIYHEIMDVAADENDVPTTEAERILHTVWCDVLNLPKDQIGVSRSFLGIGGDSITAMQVTSRCQTEYSINVTVKDILQCKSLSELAQKVVLTQKPLLERPEVFDVLFALSSVQKTYFDKVIPLDLPCSSDHQYNESLLFNFTQRIENSAVANAIYRIVEHHSILRACFVLDTEGTRMQIIPRRISGSYHFEIHNGVSRGQMVRTILEQQSTMDVETGRLFKADLFNLEDGTQLLSFLAHQLIVDQASWLVIVRDFETLMKDQSISKCLSFQTWNMLQMEQNQRMPSKEHQLTSNIPGQSSYWGLSESSLVHGNLSKATITINEEATCLLLGSSNEALRTEPADLILSILLHSFGEVFFDRPAPLVYSRERKRMKGASPFNLTNTVGPLTDFFPIYFARNINDTLLDVVRHVKDGRRQLSGNCTRGNEPMEIIFSYMDQDNQPKNIDMLLQREPLEVTGDIGPSMRLLSLFDVAAVVSDRKLQVSFTFNYFSYHQDKINRWIGNFEESFQPAVKLLNSAQKHFTLSDFPLLPVDYTGLSSLIKLVILEIGVPESNIEDIYSCSPMQEGILLSQAKDHGAYDIRVVSEVRSSEGPVSKVLLRTAWQEVVDRHPILRTIFIQNATGDGHFAQLVMKAFTVDVNYLQYNGSDAVAFLKNQPAMQRSLSQPPHQISLCETNGRVFLQVDISHALSDGAALGFLENELILAYESCLPKTRAPLYSKYIAYLQDRPDHTAIEYWNTYLEGVSPCCFPPLLEGSGDELLRISKFMTIDLAKDFDLQGICRKYEVSLANLLQATWGLVLRAYTGLDNVNFGYLTSGRDIPLEGADETLGPFINLLVCRLDLDGKMPTDIVKQMQNDYLNALPHQHASLADIKRGLGISGNALFNTAMSFQTVPASASDQKLSLEIVGMVHPTEWDVAINVMAGTEKVELTLIYWDMNMSAQQAAGVMDTFRMALKSISENSDSPINDLKLLRDHSHFQQISTNSNPTLPTSTNCFEPEADIFWKSRFPGTAPTSFPQSPLKTYQPQAYETERLTVSLVHEVTSNISSTTIVRSAWSHVVGRWSDSKDVFFGLKVTGEDLADPAIFLVPFQVSLEQEQTNSVVKFLENVQEQSIQMEPFETVGLPNIRRLGGSVANTCDFKNLLIILPSTTDVTNTNSTALRTNEDDIHNYALIVQCEPGPNQIEVVAHYDDSVISKEQIMWILSHFDTTLRQLNEQSTDLDLKDIEMLGPSDRDQLKIWNPKYPETLNICMHDMIHAQALKTPDADAVLSWDGQFTYKQLDAFSDTLAIHLRTLGVGPNVVVALCFDKCVWVPAVMLSVLKAGGAFLSLNPSHSITRLEDQISDASAHLVVAASKHARMFASLPQAVVAVGPGNYFPPPLKPLATMIVDPSCPAYLISTSGSTGKPKFPILEHRAICTSVRAQAEAFGIVQGLRVLQFAAFTFDVCIMEIFGTLAHGGVVCIPSDEDRMNDLGSAMDAMKVEFAHFTPTVLGLLNPDNIPSLKAVACGGEKMTEVVVASWSHKINLINVYGPSEASVNCACYPNFTPSTNIATIGRSLGSRLWISESDDPSRLTPIGCVGELLIEGPIISRGYLGDEVKTAAAFIESPAWLEMCGGSVHGQRVYRTGDLAKYNMDGTISILGRRDSQMKMNGLRIEAGEVEFQIKCRRPEWQDVAVEVIQQVARGGKKALAAFFQYDKGKLGSGKSGSILLSLSEMLQSDLIELQSALPASLPPYMVPSMFVLVEGMPYTVSGKLDRKGLRGLLDAGTREQLEHYSLANGVRRTPVTDMEKVLAALWAQALRIATDTVGLDDNFFQLGGDSIVAMKLVSIAREAGFLMIVSDVFKYPRLADAALRVAAYVQQPGNSVALPKPFSQLDVPNVQAFLQDVVAPRAKVNMEDIINVLEANDIQNIALAASMTESRWMLNYFYFEGTGPLDLERLREACNEWVNRIEILRTVFILHQAKFWQVVLKRVQPRLTYFETDRDLATVNDEIYHAGLRQDLTLEEPLIQFYVVKKKESLKHRIIVRISHALYDGLSWPQLIGTLQEAYEGRPSVEQHPFSEFAAVTKLQQNDECYAHWRELLSGSAMLDIVDRQSSLVAGSRSPVIRSTRTISFSPLNSEGITFATVIKSAWAYVLSQISGSSDVVFGHTIAGRNAGGDDVVGPCINVVPVRVNLQPIKKIIDLLQQVQQQQLDNIPFETLGSREIIRQCTDWSPSSFYNTIVQHQNIDEYEPFQLGDTYYEQGSVAPELEMLDMIGIHSKPAGEQMEVTLIWSPKVIPSGLADELLELLCSTIETFSSGPQQPLPTPYFAEAIIPLPEISPPVSSCGSAVGEWECTDEKLLSKTRLVLERLWLEIFFSDERNTREKSLNLDTSLFELGGDLIMVVQLHLRLREEGFAVKVEELLVHDTLESQVQLLCSISQ
ncbi:hypothetical protein MMC26_001508 [Xylographa opegraphella]|nr:hypothetical protein [Xylographa opegraphella]